MWKKILVSFFICSAILTISSTSQATGETNNKTIKQETQVNIDRKVAKKEVDISKYQITSPEEKSYTSKDKITFINGKAPSGTSITIEVYGTTDLTRKVFNLYKLPDEEDYIEIHEEDIVVGNMGLFDKQLDLVTGINKIIINFNVEGVPLQEIIIFVEPKTVKANNGVRLTDVITLTR